MLRHDGWRWGRFAAARKLVDRPLIYTPANEFLRALDQRDSIFTPDTAVWTPVEGSIPSGPTRFSLC